MNTGELLRSLIDIAGLRQKSFAERMYMSPSKMSKILSGNRVISMQDAGEFSSKAARILSDEIFTPDCYVKFGDIFPVIHDFATRFDLEQFLVDAIHYWINKELMIDDISGRCETNEHFSPQSQILNMLCIVCSDYLAADTEDGYEVYSTLLHHNHGHYAEIFSGIRVMGTAAVNASFKCPAADGVACP